VANVGTRVILELKRRRCVRAENSVRIRCSFSLAWYVRSFR